MHDNWNTNKKSYYFWSDQIASSIHFFLLLLPLHVSIMIAPKSSLWYRVSLLLLSLVCRGRASGGHCRQSSIAYPSTWRFERAFRYPESRRGYLQSLYNEKWNLDTIHRPDNVVGSRQRRGHHPQERSRHEGFLNEWIGPPGLRRTRISEGIIERTKEVCSRNFQIREESSPKFDDYDHKLGRQHIRPQSNYWASHDVTICYCRWLVLLFSQSAVQGDHCTKTFSQNEHRFARKANSCVLHKLVQVIRQPTHGVKVLSSSPDTIAITASNLVVDNQTNTIVFLNISELVKVTRIPSASSVVCNQNGFDIFVFWWSQRRTPNRISTLEDKTYSFGLSDNGANATLLASLSLAVLVMVVSSLSLLLSGTLCPKLYSTSSTTKNAAKNDDDGSFHFMLLVLKGTAKSFGVYILQAQVVYILY